MPPARNILLRGMGYIESPNFKVAEQRDKTAVHSLEHLSW